jgi:hypothetical protein
MSNQNSLARPGCHSGPSPRSHGRVEDHARLSQAATMARAPLACFGRSQPRRVERGADAETIRPRRPPLREIRRPGTAHGIDRVPFGSTARIAFSPSGPIRLPGNSFSPVAPAFSAAKHSVGVITPGQLSMPRPAGCGDHLGSALGETISAPPGSRAPRALRLRSARCQRRSAHGAKGPRHGGNRGRTVAGEFSGTSIRVIPAAISASATGRASGGVMPRRMAISGRWVILRPPAGKARSGPPACRRCRQRISACTPCAASARE